MSGTDDLKELHELTKDNDESEVGMADTNDYAAPDPIVDPYDHDDEPGTLKENARLWAVVGDAFFPADPTVNRLTAGQYSIEYSHNRGIYFAPKPVNLDDLLVLPDSASEEIVNNIEQFWGRESVFRKLGFLWKRGVLLYGPAGSGKTSTLQLVIKNVIDRDGIAVFVKDPRITAQGLEMLRRIEPVRPVIVLIEDIDALQQMHGEADLLAMLDGDLQIDNVVFIATTNYPEKLDKRLVNRPSRFDIVRKIGMPTAEARAVYLNERNDRITDTDELLEWVDATDGFSIAHLKELIVSVEALGQGFDDTIERLRIMIDSPPDSSEDDVKKTIGFSGTRKKKQQTDQAEVATADVHDETSEQLKASDDSEKS
jgi:SpoVK/Ycf46/Vps4 family AAA+-type ATPase